MAFLTAVGALNIIFFKI